MGIAPCGQPESGRARGEPPDASSFGEPNKAVQKGHPARSYSRFTDVCGSIRDARGAICQLGLASELEERAALVVTELA
ncbi:MAG: hypothetical protein M1435_00260, partial [Actinobacteria bacterium]|nr:hypothetical protein [Actinomycetota bacterium]